ncbi:hypothetical protein [Limnobacter sp.]|uniref:DUF6874 family protein n=1 Tax=Limnobacter sp. TaxID=2003368 RepID=UPI0025C15A5E|nr:hypothetical protein [Limnobacter sp.]
MENINKDALKTVMDRAAQIVRNDRDQHTLLFDIINSKVNLAVLADLPDADFYHDIIGIMQHMNRETETLEGGFIPRAGVSD